MAYACRRLRQQLESAEEEPQQVREGRGAKLYREFTLIWCHHLHHIPVPTPTTQARPPSHVLNAHVLALPPRPWPRLPAPRRLCPPSLHPRVRGGCWVQGCHSHTPPPHPSGVTLAHPLHHPTIPRRRCPHGDGPGDGPGVDGAARKQSLGPEGASGGVAVGRKPGGRTLEGVSDGRVQQRGSRQGRSTLDDGLDRASV